MQMYLADCVFPEIEGQLAAYKSFCELWDSGEMVKLDNFDGFEMLFRVHAPGAGRVTILFKAESDAQILSTSHHGVLSSALKWTSLLLSAVRTWLITTRSSSPKCPDLLKGK